MSTITAPPSPPTNFYCGKSIKGANGVQFDVFGYPLPNTLSYDITNQCTTPWSYPNQTTLFDVSSFTVNHEVIIIGYKSPFTTTNSNTTYNIVWYRNRDNSVVFDGDGGTEQASPTTPTQYNIASLIGWLGDTNPGGSTYYLYKEIQENGDYHAIISASGGRNFTQRIDFAVKGIPSSTFLKNPTSNGFDWTVRLSNYFDTSNYIEAGICTQPFADGSSSYPNGILAYNAAPSDSNGGCATSGTVSNLTQNTTYTIYGFAQAANGLYYNTGSATITTAMGPPATPMAPVLSSRGEGSLTISWNPDGSSTSYKVGWSGETGTNQAYSEVTGITGTSYTFTGLKYGYAYYFQVAGYNSTYGYGAFSNTSNPIYTAPKTPTLQIVDKTSSSITVRPHIAEGKYDYVEIYIYNYMGQLMGSQTTSNDTDCVFNSLSSSSNYLFDARTYYSGLYSVSYSNRVGGKPSSRPTNFSWDTAKTSGSTNITAVEWNRLIDKINEFLAYKGMNQWSKFNYYNGDGSFTTAATGNDFMAYQFKQVRNAINSMNPPTAPPSTVVGISTNPTTASYITADLLNGLVSSLNSIQ